MDLLTLLLIILAAAVVATLILVEIFFLAWHWAYRHFWRTYLRWLGFLLYPKW